MMKLMHENGNLERSVHYRTDIGSESKLKVLDLFEFFYSNKNITDFERRSEKFH